MRVCWPPPEIWILMHMCAGELAERLRYGLVLVHSEKRKPINKEHRKESTERNPNLLVGIPRTVLGTGLGQVPGTSGMSRLDLWHFMRHSTYIGEGVDQQFQLIIAATSEGITIPANYPEQNVRGTNGTFPRDKRAASPGWLRSRSGDVPPNSLMFIGLFFFPFIG